MDLPFAICHCSPSLFFLRLLRNSILGARSILESFLCLMTMKPRNRAVPASPTTTEHLDRTFAVTVRFLRALRRIFEPRCDCAVRAKTATDPPTRHGEKTSARRTLSHRYCHQCELESLFTRAGHCHYTSLLTQLTS